MSLLVPIRAEAAKIWSSTPSPISVSTSISPTDSIVHAGTALSIGVIAYDFDYWVESPNTGSSPGFLTQAWSTDSGYVSPGMLATWVLASDAKGLCTCLLTVDDSDSVFSPDTGSRNDPAVTHSFQVGVPTSAIAITKCDATAAGMHEINYTTTTYAATQQSLVLEYRENNSPYTSDWTAITATPELLSTTADSHQVATKTYKVMWNTLSLHNSHYEVRLRGTFYYPAFNETNSPQTSSYGVDIKNLDIAGSSPDYLVWASNGSITPSAISATLSDNAGLTNTNITIDIYNSDRTTYPTPLRTVSTTCSNSSLTYQWNGNDNNGSPCPSGVYVYKITASHTQTGGTDTICDKSTTSMSTLALSSVHTSGSSYTTDIRGNTSGAVSSGLMYIIDPKLSSLGSQSYSVSEALTNEIIKTYSYPQDKPSFAGDYTIILCGNGSDLTQDKSHTGRPLLGISVNQHVYGLSIYYNTTMEPTLASSPFNSLNGVPINRDNGFYIAACGMVESSQYLQQSIPDPGEATIAKTTLAKGDPTGYISGSDAQTGVSPALFVFDGHGESDKLIFTNSTNILASEIDTLSMPQPNTGGRLAVLLACRTAQPPTNIAYHLHQRNWTVIADEIMSTKETDTCFMDYFMPEWLEEGYGLDSASINTAFTDAQSAIVSNMKIPSSTRNVISYMHCY